MRVDLAGQHAWVEGAPAPLDAAIAAALTASGATLTARAQPGLDVLVHHAADPAATEAMVRSTAATMPRDGRIVLLTSVLALVPARGEAAASVAAAGMAHLARCLAMELAPAGIRVNALAIGALHGEQLADRLRSHAQFGPASAQDCANAVLFLVDPASSYLTGHVLAVDGGWSAGYTRDF